MTENNAAQPGLTDAIAVLKGLRSSLATHRANGPSMLCTDSRALNDADDDVLRALKILVPLSKLRAEGVQAGDERAAFNKWADSLGYELGTPTVGLMLAGWNARAALASAPASKPKRPPVDDGICWSSKEIQRRQKEEDDARAAYHHSRASAPVAGEAQITDDDVLDILAEYGEHHTEHGRIVFDKWTLQAAGEALLQRCRAGKDGENGK